MDSELIAVAARHFERLLIVLGGGLSIYLGYRMFIAIPRAAPGVFFALFGAVILGLGLQHGLTLEVREQQRAAPSDIAGGVPVGVVTERRISSAMPVGSSAPVHDSERTGVLGTVAQLSR